MGQILPRSAATVALVFFAVGLAAGQPAASRSSGDDVMKIDEAYRLAKLHQDTLALDGILADDFNETNQNGNSRNKAQTLELWKSFSITSLTTDTFQVRVTGDTAMVTGTQTENGFERMLFTRVYVKRPTGWQLLASMQFRNPNPASSASASLQQGTSRSPGVNGEIMNADGSIPGAQRTLANSS